MLNITIITPLLCMLIMRVSCIQLFQRPVRALSTSLRSSVDVMGAKDTGDILVTGLNLAQDVSVKVISCKEVIQESIMKNNLSPQAARALGEVMTCSLMMGAGLKGEETLQVNLVGSTGIGNIMVITDGDLKCRGMVGNTQLNLIGEDSTRIRNILGEGQVQVVRNHPTWKYPTNGITALRDTKISLNLALYMTESEQRTCVLLTDVRVDGSLCRHALGIMLERLPGATEDNIERAIKNLEAVEIKGLRSYLDRNNDDDEQDEGKSNTATDNSMFRNFEPVLGRVIDDCLSGMGESFRFSKYPQYRCSCGMDRIWRTLSLIPKDEIEDIIKSGEPLEMKCEFCGTKYSVSTDQVKEKILTA